MLTQLDITSRETILDGKPFGAVGAYEALMGSAVFSVDPNHDLNRPIVDLNLAPLNEEGGVDCRADIYILKPLNSSRGNGALLYHVVNRGRKGVLATFNLSAGSNLPKSAAEFGDGLLMQEGYTVAACGWQADVPPEAPGDAHLMTFDVPEAKLEGETITGVVGSEIVVDERVEIHSLGSRYHEPYEVADEENATLTVRSLPYGTPEAISRDRWSFTRMDNGYPAICFPEGFEPGLIYHVVYTGKDPKVMGLGFAATRDFVSFLKHEQEDALGNQNPLESALDRAYAFGSSQSGRFLRHLLYLGFNQDEKGRKVLDGVMAHVAGGARGSFNHRFAQPSRHTGAHTDAFYPTEQFPFTDLPQTDPISGEEGALLGRCDKAGVAPRIFYTNTSAEYWNRGASLVHTGLDGKADVALHGSTRFYHFASTQHGPGALPSANRKSWPINPVNFMYALRALLVAMDRWVSEGVEPPSSQYSRIEDGNLVPPEPDSLALPVIPRLTFPNHLHRPRRFDFGPDWQDGIIGLEPPIAGEVYQVGVPALDENGNEVGGIRMPEVAEPLGTFTGWRFREDAMEALIGLQGMWIPFPLNRQSGNDLGDSRLPISDRYGSREEYVGFVARAAMGLVEDRFMLPQDVPAVLDRAGTMYDWATRE